MAGLGPTYYRGYSDYGRKQEAIDAVIKENSIHVVIINGFGGCGKSTFTLQAAKWCKDACAFRKQEEEKVFVAEYSTIDFVKDVAKSAGWDGKKDERGRQFLADLKLAMNKYGEIPNRKTWLQISSAAELRFSFPEMNYKSTPVFFVNIRQSEDIKRFIEMKENQMNSQVYAIHTLLIKNNKPTTEPEEIKKDIMSIEYDDVITNDGTLDDLYIVAGRYIQNITGFVLKNED